MVALVVLTPCCFWVELKPLATLEAEDSELELGPPWPPWDQTGESFPSPRLVTFSSDLDQ